MQYGLYHVNNVKKQKIMKILVNRQVTYLNKIPVVTIFKFPII